MEPVSQQAPDQHRESDADEEKVRENLKRIVREVIEEQRAPLEKLRRSRCEQSYILAAPLRAAKHDPAAT